MDREDRRRYFVVASVIFDIVTPVFRKKIESDYQSKGIGSFKDFLDHQRILHILFHLRYKNTWCCQDRTNCACHGILPLNYSQWDLLYSQNPGVCSNLCHCQYTAKPVQTEDLDITLASLILLNCCTLSANEVTLIKNLRNFKNNYLSHNSKGAITQGEYNTLWTDLTNYVLQLDPSKKQDDLKIIELRPLDESLCTKYVGSLLDVHKKLDEMDVKMDANNAALVKKIDVLINRSTCYNCTMNKSSTQNEPYRLGQDIFTVYHQYNLGSVPNADWLRGKGGGVMMDDGRLVLCLPLQYRLLICNTDGSEADSIPLQSFPVGVTAVNNSTVAVTLPMSHCIEMYNINNKNKLKSILVPRECYGITTINDKLVVSCWGRLLMIDDQTEEVVHTVNTDCSLPARLHTTGDRLFYCDYNDNYNLYCYSYTDDKVSTLCILPSPPCSITSLQDDSLYVVCGDRSVQHVSSDVQHYKPVNTKGLKPLRDCNVISYNGTQRKLFTYDMSGNVKIFELK